MNTEPGWVPPEIDTKRANVARVYDYLLGGTHNFLADQDVARNLLAIEPASRIGMRSNRAFLARAVRFLADAGIRQFLDIGSGIPTEGNVHEIAQAAAPGAKVVYVDSDPTAIAHSQAILDGNPSAAIVPGDLREPEVILNDPVTRRLIDLSQPVGLVLAAIVHFIIDSEQARGIVSTLISHLAPGSYLVLSHGTSEGNPDLARAAETIYNRNVSSAARLRSRAEILPFFEGLELLEPGLVTTPYWRPDPPGPPADADKAWFILAGVARKA